LLIEFGTDDLRAVASAVAVITYLVNVTVVGACTVAVILKPLLSVTIGTVNVIAVRAIRTLNISTVAITVANVAVITVALGIILEVSKSIKCI